MTAWLEGALGQLVELAVRASALLAVAHAMLWLLRRRSAATRELVGRWFGVALCALPVLACSGLSLGVLPSFAAAEEPATVAFTVSPLEVPFEFAAPTTVIAAPATSPAALLAAGLLLVWGLGAGAFACSTLLGHALAMRRLFGRGARALPAELLARLGIADARLVTISPATAQPVVAGLLRPRIAVPPAFLGWPPARQRAVLAHERAHVDRRDGLAALVWQLARAIWWPHPLIWTLGRQLTLAREQACDDRALADGGGAIPYAEALVDTARALRRAVPSRSPMLAMTTTSQLEARVRALLRPDVRRARPRALAHLAAALAVSCFGLLCAAGDAIAQEVPPPPPPEAERPLQPPAPPVEPIVLAVTAEGAVLYAGRDIGVGGVRALVERKLANRPRPIVVECARDVRAAVLVRVVDEAKAAGAEQVSIATPAEHSQARIVHRPAPKLPAALRAHTPARVMVHFVVDERGRVVEPEVVESTDVRFDRPALDALETWRFEPARKDGEPVRSRVRMPIVFPAPDGDGGDAREPAAASAAEQLLTFVYPRPVRKVAPKLTEELKRHRPAIVWLSFVVDEHGRVSSPVATRSTDPRFEKTALDAIEQWVFEPGTRGGEKAVMEVEVAIPFVDDTWLERGERPPALEGEATPVDLEALERRIRKRRTEEQR